MRLNVGAIGAMPGRMKRLRLVLCLAPLATPLQAADRRFFVGEFDRIRIEGACEVRLVTRGAPSARASGSAAAIGALDIQVEAGTLWACRGVRSRGRHARYRRSAPLERA